MHWLLSQVQEAAASDDTVQRWVAVMGAFVVGFGILMRYARRIWITMRDWSHKIDAAEHGWSWVQSQMMANGIAQKAGTDRLTVRELLDLAELDRKDVRIALKEQTRINMMQHEENRDSIARLEMALRSHLQWSAENVEEVNRRLSELENGKE